jgi:hypothetical protein
VDVSCLELQKLTVAVLGPMVYAAAYCPVSFKPTLEGIGFDGK